MRIAEEASHDLCPRIRSGHLRRPHGGKIKVLHLGPGCQICKVSELKIIMTTSCLNELSAGGECAGVRTRGGLNSSRLVLLSNRTC